MQFLNFKHIYALTTQLCSYICISLASIQRLSVICGSIILASFSAFIEILCAFSSILVASVSRTFYHKRPWLDVYLDMREFENLFKDSGYWDYFLLAIYDYAFRVYIVYTLLIITDYSIVEKASWLLISALLQPLNFFFFFEFKSLHEFFFCVIFLILTIWSLIFFCNIILMFI